MDNSRIHIFFERHIGVGIRWRRCEYPFELSIAFPFVSMDICFGSKVNRVLAREPEGE